MTENSIPESLSNRPLSSLLSQVLIAYTLEFDNEFSTGFSNAGYPGINLSLVLWSNLIRFLADRPLTVRELTSKALERNIKPKLGCLERWHIINLEINKNNGMHNASLLSADSRNSKREGFGSSRRILPDTIVHLTKMGQAAVEVWSPLPDVIDNRWQQRFGDERISCLQNLLKLILDYYKLQLPDALPSEFEKYELYLYKRLARQKPGKQSLATLLSRALLLYACEFEREPFTSIKHCANILRVLSEDPIPLTEVPKLTGLSPECCSIGWRLRAFVLQHPQNYINRGKQVSLSSIGCLKQQHYYKLTQEIEQEWEEKMGTQTIQQLREVLIEILTLKGANGTLIAQGLIPSPGTVRSGCVAPALGRQDIGAAAKRRALQMAAQSEAFIASPTDALPHFPVWDMKRGYGP